MGRLVRVQEVGEGMKFEGRGRNIKLTISEITGPVTDRQATFGVEGVEGLTKVTASQGGDLAAIIDEIKVGVTPDQTKIGHNKTKVCYGAPNDYKMDRQEYPKQ